MLVLTEMFHPNIDVTGQLTVTIEEWSPASHVASVLLSIQSLLADPNTSSPANETAARLYDSDRAEYQRRVRETVDQSLRTND